MMCANYFVYAVVVVFGLSVVLLLLSHSLFVYRLVKWSCNYYSNTILLIIFFFSSFLQLVIILALSDANVLPRPCF